MIRKIFKNVEIVLNVGKNEDFTSKEPEHQKLTIINTLLYNKI